MDDHLLRILTVDNPWLKGAGVAAWCRRHLPFRYVNRLVRPAPDHRAALIVGPRQAGKSSLIWKTLSQTGKPFLYVNCEETAVRHWLDSPAAFLDDVCSLGAWPLPLFFDEVQRLSDAGIFLKGLNDRRPGVPVYATGSSSFDLEARTRESLAGRALRHLLLPFSLAELMATAEGPSAVRRATGKGLIEKMLLHGGYPTVVRSRSPDLELTTLVESFVIRDASDRFKIRHPAAFRKVLELAASQIGNLCNYSEWASLAGVSNDTVAEYVRLLEDAHVVRAVRPFMGGRRAELTSTPKIYFVDNGVRNVLFGGFQRGETRSDHGALWENLVFSEILKCTNPLLDQIRFWRSKAGAEVDFILERKGGVTAIETKAGDCRGKLTKSARSFIEAYKPPRFIVVNSREYLPVKIEKTKVLFIRLPELRPHLIPDR